MQSLNHELINVKEKLRQKKKWETRLKNVLDKIEAEERKLEKLQQKTEREQKDVDKLEGLSVASIFYALMGRKLEKLDKEKQELIAAQLKYKEASLLVRDLNKEMKDLHQKLATVSTIEDDYNKLLIRKESLIHAQNSKLSLTLYDLLDQE